MLKDLGTFLLRLLFGLIIIVRHGIDYAINFSQIKDYFPSMLGLDPALGLGAIISINIICGFFVVLGFFTRFFSSLIALSFFTMSFLIMGSESWERREFLIASFVVYLSLLLTGPGKLSFDYFFERRRRRKPENKKPQNNINEKVNSPN